MAQIRKPQEASYADGTVAIEYGLILPAMLLFTLGIMDPAVGDGHISR